MGWVLSAGLALLSDSPNPGLLIGAPHPLEVSDGVSGELGDDALHDRPRRPSEVGHETHEIQGRESLGSGVAQMLAAAWDLQQLGIAM